MGEDIVASLQRLLQEECIAINEKKAEYKPLNSGRRNNYSKTGQDTIYADEG